MTSPACTVTAWLFTVADFSGRPSPDRSRMRIRAGSTAND